MVSVWNLVSVKRMRFSVVYFFSYFIPISFYLLHSLSAWSFFSFPGHLHKIITYVKWTFPHPTFFFFIIILFYHILIVSFQTLDTGESGNSSGCSCFHCIVRRNSFLLFFFLHGSICGCMCMHCVCCVYVPSLGKGCEGTRPSINPTNVHEKREGELWDSGQM